MAEEQNTSGEELYRRFLSGDDNAFDELVALYEDELSNFLNGIVNDYHEAKHLTIETFARLFASGGKFTAKASLKTYLFTIGKNLAFRYVKMRNREQHVSFDEAIESLVDEDESPYGCIKREENKRLLQKAMSELKNDHRAVLALLYFEDMSYIHAGQALSKTETQIRGLAYRAKVALKKKLEDSGYIHK